MKKEHQEGSDELNDDSSDIEIMDTLNSADKEHRLGKPQLSASEILLKYKSKIIEKEKAKKNRRVIIEEN